MPAERPAFQRYQAAFTAHIRDPRNQPRPAGVPARRMRVYNELLFNNIESALLVCFPITRRILGARAWKTLAREFFSHHKCQGPLYRQVSEEFVRYLRQRQPGPADPVFLADFAHYEWIELAVDISPAEPVWDEIDPAGDLMQHPPVVNPTLRLLEYPYAVHRIGPRFRPTAPDAEPTRLLVFRDKADGVRFVVVNAVSARLVALLSEDAAALSGEAACLRIAAELGHPDPSVVVAGGAGILRELWQQDAILGTRKVNRHARD